MNAKQAKRLSLPSLMKRLGYTPSLTKNRGSRLEYWYPSPFRDEKKPSLQVTQGKQVAWIWNDHGDHAKGTIIDFVMRLKGYNTVSQALEFLSDHFPGSLFETAKPQTKRVGEGKENNPNLFSFTSSDLSENSQHTSNPVSERDLVLLAVKPLQSPLIFSYLKSRSIPKVLAEQYLVLIQYQNQAKPKSKPYFAFGFKNILGGYEIRSATDTAGGVFKSAVNGKAVSFIKGSRQGRGEVSVFEGVLDFLSLLVILDTKHLNGDALILNGLEMYEHSGKDFLTQHQYRHIHLFLDNNPAGEVKTQIIREDFGDIVTTHSSKFLPHEDLNDALRNSFKPNFSSPQPGLS